MYNRSTQKWFYQYRYLSAGEVPVEAGLVEREHCLGDINNCQTRLYSDEDDVVIIAWPAHHDVGYLVPRIVAAEEEIVFSVGNEQFVSSFGHQGVYFSRFV